MDYNRAQAQLHVALFPVYHTRKRRERDRGRERERQTETKRVGAQTFVGEMFAVIRMFLTFITTSAGYSTQRQLHYMWSDCSG